EDKLSNLKALDYKRFRPAVQAWFADRPAPAAEKQYQPLLEVHGLTYSYDGEKNALEDVSFKIGKGEFVSILGKNGSGKSTITKLIMGVIDADSGSSYLNGEDLSELSIFERSQKVGVVMQNPNHMISHHMIFDEIAFGLRNRNIAEELLTEKVEHVLELCGLSKFRHWPIEALSYGQKKRVTIASILVLEPELLILDEPTAGQDYRNYTSMLAFIQKLNRDLGITVVIISHDMHLVLEYTTRSIVIADSKLIANAAMTEVFSQPSLLERANLCTTSIYELATMMKIDDTNAFMQYFIDYERSSL
ncbi:UNVERIFIED_CONTAM: hypothetical protein GTU68_056312, partial [Idotea baltica]|nr:hypothetical protein [Idotea baltica]